MADFSAVISGAEVFDGRGPGRRADVGLRDGSIAAVGDLTGAEAAERVDGAGLSLLPGFVDTHTHADLAHLMRPGREEALLQGVTTEIIGACGIGCYPLRREDAGYLRLMKGLLAADDPALCFESLRAYWAALPPCGVNTAAQISHSPARYRVLGCADAPMTEEPLRRMLALVRQAFADGACALSTGLAYYPAAFGDGAELAALCGVARECDAPVTFHQRTALRRPEPAFDPRREVLEMARQTGCSVVYSHFRTNAASAGRPETVTAYPERGRAQGLEVTADFYPYPVGCGYTAVQLPMWCMDGGAERILARLGDPAAAREIAGDMAAAHANLADGRIVHAPATPELVGRAYTEAADAMGMRVPEFLVWLLRENRLEVAYIPLLPAEREAVFAADFAAFLRKPYYMGGSDTLPMLTLRHPRCRSTFPKLLRIAREHGISMADMANRLAALPAETYRLPGRGRILPGYAADLVLLDPHTVGERGDFAHPETPPEGIRAVWVNGRPAVRDGRVTGVCAGVPVRRA